MTQDDIKEAMWSMSHIDRCAMLVFSILQDKQNEPAVATGNIFRFGMVTAQYLNSHDRIRLSEKLRDMADELEHRQPELGGALP